MKTPAFLTILMGCLLSACSDAGLMVANTPSYFSGTKIIRDVPYGSRQDEKLDLYIPAKPPANANGYGTIVFFYGGGWKAGHRQDYRFVGDRFAREGYIVAIPDYRKYPEVKFPAFVEDGAAAVAWVSDHIAEYKGDATHLHVMGHSAGGHLAAMIVADKKYLAAFNKTPASTIRSFVGLSGPYDFTPDEPDYVAIFGPPANYPTMQAPTFIDGTEPPMLLIYGGDDTLVGKVNIEKLSAKIHEKKGRVQTIIYSGIGHIGTVSALTWLNPGSTSETQDILTFLNSVK